MGLRRRKAIAAMIPLSLLLLVATVSTSHAAARMDDRLSLALATAVHHLGTAAWIGAMPFLLISLGRAETVEEARAMARRYSSMALLSVAVLVLAGIYMAWFYVGTWNGLYGTSYGVLLLAKIYLLLVMLLMGTGNLLLVRRLEHRSPAPAGEAPALCRGRAWLGIHHHSGCCFDVCAAACGRCPREGVAAGDCRPHAPGDSALDEPGRCRSLPRPLRSKPRSTRTSSRPTGAAMPQTGDGRNITITGRA